VGRYVDDQFSAIDSDSDGLVDTGPGEIFTQSAGTWQQGKVVADTLGATVRNLQSVSCASVAACAATGDTRDALGAFHGGWLLTRWDGTWAAAARAPLPGAAAPVGGSVLAEVSCASARACAAVGSFADGGGLHHGWLVSAAPATPAISITAPATVTPGTPIAGIRATLSGGVEPTGTLTWRVFGPQATAPGDCSAGGTSLGSVAVSSNGEFAPAQAFTPPAEGRYWWFASYGGDASDLPAGSPCGPAMASTLVATPPVVTPTPPPGGATATPTSTPTSARDVTPPNTRITKGPVKTRSRRPVFRFASTEAGSTFRCKVDRQPFRPCRSGSKLARLKPGSHTLRVKALDAAGNADPTPAIKRFRITR
jgi:hypothetical protein